VTSDLDLTGEILAEEARLKATAAASQLATQTSHLLHRACILLPKLLPKMRFVVISRTSLACQSHTPYGTEDEPGGADRR